MAADTYSDQALARDLALNVCDQWKLQNGYRTLSPDDLAAVKKWLRTPRATISKFPELQALAAKGNDDLIVRHQQARLHGGNLRRL
jgi:hypothetical protein